MTRRADRNVREGELKARPGHRPASTMPRTVACTFATREYAGSAATLRKTALLQGGFDAVYVYDEADVADWFAAHPDLLPASSRGYGSWSWKPWVIGKALERVAPGDLVVYFDAGVAVEEPLALEHVADVGLFLLPGQQHPVRAWTKAEALRIMGVGPDDPVLDAQQVNAAVQVWRHTPQALAVLDAYRRFCGVAQVVCDAPLGPQAPGFQDHRHDQSVLSVLARRHPDAVALDPRDYTQFGDPAHRRLLHHRKALRPARVAVFTPTTGTRYLAGCVRSVQAQQVPNVVHYVVVDGPEHEAAVRHTLREFEGREPVRVLVLPVGIGRDGWLSHRCYGAAAWLVDDDTRFVAFLDEDNEMEPDHLRLLLRGVVNAGVTWGHSLRRIIDAEGRDVCPDNCESLGGICHTACGPGDRLVDTSCYLLDRELAVRVSPTWHVRARPEPPVLEADRALLRRLLPEPHIVVRQHTLRYRAGNNERSVRADFFRRGNAAMGYDFAARPDLYLFHFSPKATAAALAARLDASRSHALEEWQLTLHAGLAEEYNLLDGYACADHIPTGAAVLVTMCQPDQVPWELLRERTDLWRLLYTAESPNVRHAGQWDPALLGKHFDAVLTYWEALLADPRVPTVFCPHNTHHLRFANPLDAAQLRANTGVGRSCGMVLERRDLRGVYRVPNVAVDLRCLDLWREALVRDLDDVTVFGEGWDGVATDNPGFKVGHALHRSRDTRTAVDTLSAFTFAVIAENCDAEGYVSEKLYDALMAGCIPLYYGNPSPRLPVPEGPEAGVYLDLRRVVGDDPAGASLKLRDYLRALDDDTLAAWRARVLAERERVLRLVDADAFAAAVREALALCPV